MVMKIWYMYCPFSSLMAAVHEQFDVCFHSSEDSVDTAQVANGP